MLVVSLLLLWIGLIIISWIRIVYFVRDISAVRANSELARASFKLKSGDVEGKDFDALYSKIERWANSLMNAK